MTAVVDQALGKALRRKQVDGQHRVPPRVVHVREQLVAGDPGVVDQDVGVAVVVVAQMFGDPLDGVVGGDVERQRRAADAGGRLGQRLGGGLHVDRHDAGPVAREHLGDRRADAARGTGHDADLAVQRPVPVGDRGGVGGADVEHLAVHVGRLGRQQEPQGRLEAGGGRLGVGGQVDQRDGARRAAVPCPASG